MAIISHNRMKKLLMTKIDRAWFSCLLWHPLFTLQETELVYSYNPHGAMVGSTEKYQPWIVAVFTVTDEVVQTQLACLVHNVAGSVSIRRQFVFNLSIHHSQCLVQLHHLTEWQLVKCQADTTNEQPWMYMKCASFFKSFTETNTNTHYKGHYKGHCKGHRNKTKSHTNFWISRLLRVL